MQQCSSGSRRADQVVTQNGRPEFALNHLRRFAAQMPQIEIRLKTANIQFAVPAESIQLGDVRNRVLLSVSKRGNDLNGSCPATFFAHGVAQFAEGQLLRNLPIER